MNFYAYNTCVAILLQLFKAGRTTIYNWQRKGLLTFTQFGGRRYFDADDVEAATGKNKRSYEVGRRSI